MVFLLLTPWVLVFILCPRVWPVEPGVFITEGVQLKIADAFFDEAEYYRAVTEYKKFLILFPASQRTDYAFFKIASAYLQGEEYDSAAHAFAVLREKCPSSPYGISSRYLEGVSCWRSKDIQRAWAAFRAVIISHPSSPEAPLALAASALIALDKEAPHACRQDLEELRRRYPEHTLASRAQEALDLLDQYQKLPQKSEFVAGAMSAVLPGSGYLYAGRCGDGVTAFLLNGLGIAGAITAANQGNYAVSTIVGGVGLPFYFGNIYGSANAAKRWNAHARSELRHRIRTTLGFEY